MTKTHQMSRTRFYASWREMKRRCYNENVRAYKWYGARGITVCERWRVSFELFFSDVGTRPPGMTIERIDNEGNYEPGNVRWATQKEQSNNTRASRWIELAGQRMTLMQWAEKTGLRCETISKRLDLLGWSVERALTAKPRHKELPSENAVEKQQSI